MRPNTIVYMSILLHKLLEMIQNFCSMWMQNVRLEAVPAKVFSNHAESLGMIRSVCAGQCLVRR